MKKMNVMLVLAMIGGVFWQDLFAIKVSKERLRDVTGRFLPKNKAQESEKQRQLEFVQKAKNGDDVIEDMLDKGGISAETINAALVCAEVRYEVQEVGTISTGLHDELVPVATIHELLLTHRLSKDLITAEALKKALEHVVRECHPCAVQLLLRHHFITREMIQSALAAIPTTGFNATSGYAKKIRIMLNEWQASDPGSVVELIR